MRLTPEEWSGVCERIKREGTPADKKILSVMLRLREYLVEDDSDPDKMVECPAGLISDLIEALELIEKYGSCAE